MCELLWSDPQPGAGRAPSKRGVGVAFGADVTQRFLQDNGLDLLVRSHEVRAPSFASFLSSCDMSDLSIVWALSPSSSCKTTASTCCSCATMRCPPWPLSAMLLHRV